MTDPQDASPLPSRVIRLGTRRSALALYQTHHVRDLLLAAYPGTLAVEIVEMDTTGDKIRDVPLPEIGAKGLFTQELEDKILSGDLDLAVHSLKDLPSRLPDGLKWAGSPKRGTPTDCIVSKKWSGLDALPEGALVATGSVRRRAMLQHLRPDLRFSDLRGNIGTRLRKLTEFDFDAIIMATTALERLDMHDRITESLPPERFTPAVGQGAIGLEIAKGREELEALLAPILDDDTTTAASAERAFMRILEGGCSAPVAAHCSRNGVDTWHFTGWVGALDGSRVLRESITCDDPVDVARRMATSFIDQGARELMTTRS